MEIVLGFSSSSYVQNCIVKVDTSYHILLLSPWFEDSFDREQSEVPDLRIIQHFQLKLKITS